MLRAAVFLFALFALTAASPMPPLGDFPPHPGCHYNITPQANFKVLDGGFLWYYDSVTFDHSFKDVTCLNLAGKFKTVNNLSFFQFVQHAHDGSYKVDVSCAGPNYAGAHADFALTCKVSGSPTVIDWQFRIAETDHKTYALITSCAGKAHGPYAEGMGIIGPKKTGVDPAVRQRLIKRLVAAGWDANIIRRVPSQSGC